MKLHERIVLHLYGLLMAVARPVLRRKLQRRARAEPGYAVDVAARFGHVDAATAAPQGLPSVWVHAVSLGETRVAAVLVAALRERQPDLRLLLTHSTATGRAEGGSLLREGDVQTWLPWDDPWSVRRFLRAYRPTVGVLMETEVWPQLVQCCRQEGVALVLANARLNETSARRAARLGWLSRPAFAGLAAVWAQTDADAQRLKALGAPVQGVWGNLKFDARPDNRQVECAREWRRGLGRPVVMLASSREGEEAEFLRQICLLAQNPSASIAIENIVFLVVPRHPQRFDEVALLCAQAGCQVLRRSQWGDALEHGRPLPVPQAAPAVWLGDSLGEMSLYATLADVALLGGSFEPLGGQNLIELAACGCPLVLGPHTFNFEQAARQAIAAGAAQRVPGLSDGVQVALGWLASEPARAQAALAAQRWADAEQGGATRTARAVLALAASAGSLSGPSGR
jgi:3-deoxy-D-manno-octulosonic-acid transferase